MRCHEVFKLILQSKVVIQKHFPRLLASLSEMPDERKRPQYTVEELLKGAISIFLFKRGSRNNTDNTAKKGFFSLNLTLRGTICRPVTVHPVQLEQEVFWTSRH